MSRMIPRGVAVVALLTSLLAGCASAGRGRGPLDAFTLLAAANPALSRDIVGAIDERVEPKEIRLVVPAGTDVHSLAATLSLSKEAAIEVVSSGTPVAQKNGVTRNDFSVPVTYSITVPGEKKPWTYTVLVRESESNARLGFLSTPAGSVLQPSFNSAIHDYSLEVPYASDHVRIEARGQTSTLSSVTIDGAETLGPAGAAVIDFTGRDTRGFTIETLAEDGQTREVYKVTLVRGAPDTNTALALLDLQQIELQPDFSPSRPSYEGVTPFETTVLTIHARPQSSVATVQLDQAGVRAGSPALRMAGDPAGAGGAQVDFSVGNRLSLLVTVTAESGDSRQYLVDVLRATPDGNNLLASLALTSGGAQTELSPVFSPGRFSYVIEVPYSARTVTVAAVLSSRLAQATIEPAATSGSARTSITFTGNLLSKAGATIEFAQPLARLLFAVAVTAQDGGVQRTVIDVRRAQPDRNADMASLTASAGTLSPQFSPRAVAYTLSLPSSAESVRIAAAAAGAGATVSVAEQPAVKPAASVTATLALKSGTSTILTFVVSAEDGTQRLYRLSVTREAAPPTDGGTKPTDGGTTPTDGGVVIVNPPSDGGGTPSNPPPADVGTDHVTVSMKNLKIAAQETAALKSAGDQLSGKARITVRYYRSNEVITQYTLPVDVKQQGSAIAVTLAYKSNGVTLARSRLVEVETALLTSKGKFLWYTEAQQADNQVDIEPPFFIYGDNPQVRWPATASMVAVTGYVSNLPTTKARAVDKEDFDKNTRGEYTVTAELFNAQSGASYGKGTVQSKPGEARNRTYTFATPIRVPEGATIKYVLSAKAKNGKTWSATGTMAIWTTRMAYPEGFAPLVLSVNDDLAPEAKKGD